MRFRLVLLAALAALLLPAAAAHAALVQINGTTLIWYGTNADETVTISGSASLIGGGAPQSVTFNCATSGPGACTMTVDSGSTTVCPTGDGTATVTCNGSGIGNVASVTALASGGNDSVTWSESFLGNSLSLPVNFSGSTGNDTLNGSSSPDTLRGGDGADTLNGGGGGDTIYGQDLNTVAPDGGDTINGGGGSDAILGDDGDDVISGGAEADGTVDGGGGTDQMRYDELGRAGGVIVTLGDATADGSSTERAGGENPVNFENVAGSSGDDDITGDGANNAIDGGLGADRLDGGPGSDAVAGGDGDDTLVADPGSDSMDGGPGTDTGDWSARNEPLDISVGDADHADGGPTDGAAGARDVTTSLERLLGGSAGDKLASTGATAVTFVGNGGDDQLVGTDAGDTFIGGPGSDSIDGKGGADTMRYDEAARTEGVTVTLNAGNGDDGSAFDANSAQVRDSVNNVENIVGTAFGDQLTGDSGANVIAGLAGNDLVQGGAGTDVLSGGDGSDTVSYADHSDATAISLDGKPNDGSAGENDDVASDFENATGGSGADKISGNDAANVLEGGAGADDITGGGAVDTFRAGTGDDTVHAFDGTAEPVDCGDGTDTAEVDTIDTLTGCEASAVAKLTVDADRDGFGADKDCNDNNAAIKPGAVEIAGNAVDENCDGIVAPFPTISTSITASFAARAKTVVTRLTFAPVVAGTTIQVICKAPKHKKCPFAKTTRKITTAVKKVNLLRIFKKQALAPKTVVQIRVTAPGAIGKYRKFVMRKRKAPVKTSRCLRPGSITPTAC